MDGVARRARRPRPRRRSSVVPRGRRDLEGRRVSWIEKSRARLSVGEIAFVDAGDPEAPAVLLSPAASRCRMSGGTWSRCCRRSCGRSCRTSSVSDLVAEAPTCGSSRTRASARAAGAPRDRTVRRRRSWPRRRDRGPSRSAGSRGARPDRLDRVRCAWPSPSIAELRERVDVDPAFIRSWFDGFFDRGMGHRDRLSDADLAEYRRPFERDDGVERFTRIAAAFDGRASSASNLGRRARDPGVRARRGRPVPARRARRTPR